MPSPPSWLHAPLPRGHSCQSWDKDMHFWCEHHKLAFTQHSRCAAVPCLIAMKLCAGLMHNRSICWHLLPSEHINVGQSSKFPVRRRISEFVTHPCFPLCIRLQIWSQPLQHSGRQSREVACNSSLCGERKRAVAFLSFCCSSWEISIMGCRGGASQGVYWKWNHRYNCFKSRKKNCLFQLKLETLTPSLCLQE